MSLLDRRARARRIIRFLWLALFLLSLFVLALGVSAAADYWLFGGYLHQAFIHVCVTGGAFGAFFAARELIKD